MFDDDRQTAFYEVLDAYEPDAPLRRPDVAAPLRVPAARLRRVHDLQRVLQGAAAGHPRAAHRADGRRHRRAPLQARRRAPPPGQAGDRHRRRRRVRRGPHADRDRRRARRRATGGRAWLEELERIKDPWFNMAVGDGLYHYYGSWYDDPSIPYASVTGHIRALKAGEQVERPSEEIARERDRLAEEYGALLDEETRKTFHDLLGLSRTVFPYVEEHKFYCDYWFLTRWWNKLREFGALLAGHGFLADAEDMFQLGRHEVAEALDELLLTWATGGAPAGPSHWPPIVARRKELLERLAEWTPPPAIGVDAGGDHRPDVDHALGRHDPARPGVGEREGGRLPADRRGGLARHGRRPGTGRDHDRGPRRGARRRRARLPDHLARVGADLPEGEGRGHRHRRRHVARRDRLPRVRPPRGRRHRPRDRGDPHRTEDPGRRLDRRRHDSSTRELYPPATGATARRRRGVRRQEREPRRPARSRHPGPARVRDRRRRLPGVRPLHRPRRDDRLGPHPRRGRRLEGDRRGDALRAVPGRPARRARRPLRGARSPAGRRPLERARRGQPRRHPRRRSRRATSGCAESTQLCDAVRECWASLYTPRAIAYRAQARRRPRRRWA